MKIYNKKAFASGVFMTGLGVLNLAMDILNGSTDLNGIILVTLLFLFGFGTIMRSLSKRLTREDKLEALDERNQLIELKSKSQSFRLTQIISFLLMLVLLVMGKISGYKNFITMGVGLAFALYQANNSPARKSIAT